jgi:hypothetical protein
VPNELNEFAGATVESATTSIVGVELIFVVTLIIKVLYLFFIKCQPLYQITSFPLDNS